MSVDAKLARLRETLAACPSALIAFSGGVDSAFLLRVAAETLGARCTALTTVSPTTPAADLADARRLAADLGVTHVVVEADELAIPGYAANGPERCYLCKDHLYDVCRAEAARHGIAVILDGVNVDDLGDHRPGLRAAAEQHVRHPLVEAEFSKADIRLASRALQLETWDRPASPCLSSRFPYGTTITVEGLRRVASAEDALRAEGFRELRVRYHDRVARIELPLDEAERLLEPSRRERIVRALKEIGFDYVALDLQGFRSGSLNEVLGRRKHEGPGG
jgi:pyridinium-3,5-biscarboxylic acid mononucleotide sulfurtransferase